MWWRGEEAMGCDMHFILRVICLHEGAGRWNLSKAQCKGQPILPKCLRKCIERLHLRKKWLFMLHSHFLFESWVRAHWQMGGKMHICTLEAWCLIDWKMWEQFLKIFHTLVRDESLIADYLMASPPVAYFHSVLYILSNETESTAYIQRVQIYAFEKREGKNCLLFWKVLKPQ